MPLMVDITGQKFGMLTAISPTEKRENGAVVWLCQCDCGRTKEISGRALRSGIQTSCGCSKQKYDIYPGLIYPNGTKVIKKAKNNPNGEARWECQCFCGNIFIRNSHHLRRNSFTPSCGCLIESKGEKKIALALKSLNIKYIQQYIFDNCRNPKTNCLLRFDFYLPDYNYCIEYDGKQHFQEWTFGDDALIDRQYRDNIKNQYCQDNKIKLIRIPYTELDNINAEYLRKKVLNV